MFRAVEKPSERNGNVLKWICKNQDNVECRKFVCLCVGFKFRKIVKVFFSVMEEEIDSILRVSCAQECCWVLSLMSRKVFRTTILRNTYYNSIIIIRWMETEGFLLYTLLYYYY